MNQFYLPIISKVTEAYWSHILLCSDLFVRISTKALCSSLIAFIINGQDEQKKKKYRKIDDKIANLVANYESENEMEFLKGISSNLHLFQNLFINELVNSYRYCNVYLYFFIQSYIVQCKFCLSQNLYMKCSSSDIT